MKAIISEELIRKSRSGKSVLTKMIIGTKENIVEKTNTYIYERLARTNLIPVKNFKVELFTQRGKKVNT